MATLTAKGLERRGEILAAADKLFRELGYENTTLRMIAQQVNISCGHLEHYFREKRDLIYELSETMISNIWDKSPEICSEDEDPLVTYAFAVYWLFLICSHLEDVRRITFEYVKDLDNQLAFSDRFARRYTDSLDIDEESKESIRNIVGMAFAAQLCSLHRYDDKSFTDEIARRTSAEHVRIMCLLQHRDIEEADRTSKKVCDAIDKLTVERMTKPFTKDYRWYVIKKHPFSL